MPQKPYRKELGKPVTQKIPEQILLELESITDLVGVRKRAPYYEIIEASIKVVKAQKSHKKITRKNV